MLKQVFKILVVHCILLYNGGCTDDPTADEGYQTTSFMITSVADTYEGDGSYVVSANVSWSNDDELWVFDESGRRYIFGNSDRETAASAFSCPDWRQGHVPQYALFNPEYQDAKFETGKIYAEVSATQTIVGGESFDRDASVAVGKVTENGHYTVDMRNLCGLLKVQLLVNDVSKIVLRGNDNEKIAGEVDIDYNGGDPVWAPGGKMRSQVALIPRKNSGQYVKGTYYFCLLPQTLEKGAVLAFTNTSGYVADIHIAGPIVLERNRVVDLGSFGNDNLVFRRVEVGSPEEIDFSRIGYHFGESEFPAYDDNVVYLDPIGNGATADDDLQIDRLADINDAIKNVKKPGTVVLRAGRYYVSSGIRIADNKVILRGEIDRAADDPRKRNLATIISTRKDDSRSSLLVLGNSNRSCAPLVIEPGVAITNSYLPEGSMSVIVADAGSFNVGDRVIVYRPHNEAWIHDLGMDRILHNGSIYAWTDYNNTLELQIERIVTGKQDNIVYFDNPLPMSLDAQYGGGMLYHYMIPSARITESGVEDLNFDTLFDKSVTSTQNGGSTRPIDTYYADENHSWNAVRVMGAEHCWVKGVTGTHFSFSTVSIYGYSKNITVEDCHSYEPVSVIVSPRRYAFAIGQGQLCLFKNCTADKDRHQFVTTGSGAIGPNAFVRCMATNSYSNAGPHAEWATCTLYDCLKTDQLLSAEDAYYLGYSSGAQGWQGANQIFWNCEAQNIICQSPQVSARNWAWGCIGVKQWGSLDCTKSAGDRPDGEWNSHGTHLFPESLYEWQLEQRLADMESLLYLIQ